VVPCRGVQAQGFLALGLDGGYEGGVVLLHGFLYVLLFSASVRLEVYQPTLDPVFYLLLNIMIYSSPACSRKKI
jgi:hypothetical protein